MRLRPVLLLGLLLGAEAARFDRRQNSDTDSAVDSALESAVGSNTDITSETSVESEPTSTSVAADPTTSTSVAPAETTTSVDQATSTTDNGGAATTTSADAGDSTVTRTTTVAGDGDAVSRTTTVMRTLTSTITVTGTVFETKTVTSRDQDTATKIVYETTTTFVNEKRAISMAPRTAGPNLVDAQPTDAPSVTQINWHNLDVLRPKLERHVKNNDDNQLQKRAVVTEMVTVTAKGDAKTMVNSVTSTVITTTSTRVDITKTLTETEQADAKTTITSTSTLVITSTRLTTGVVVTVTEVPTGNYGADGTGVPTVSSDSSSGSDDKKDDSGSGGLSTGAKAGIGVGAGVGGLAVLGLLGWLLLRRRRDSKHDDDDDDMFGASEVPIGGPTGEGTIPSVSHNPTATAGAAAFLAPNRMPSQQSSAAEGYRGTAMGDGRAGYAHPQTFGSSYTQRSPETTYTRTTLSGADQLPEHPSPVEHSAELGSDGTAGRWHKSNAVEMDSTPSRPTTTSPPPQNVYEMPAQHYQ